MKAVFRTLMTDLRTVYTDSWFLSDENLGATLETWYNALCDLNYDQLKRAIDEYISTNEKPPMPSQIRQMALTKEGSQPPLAFDTNAFWRQFNYWVLTDLRGYFINEIVAEASLTADDVAEHFKKAGYDLSGTTIKKEEHGKYRPKYLPAPNPKEEEVIRELAPREPLVTSSPRLSSPEKQTAFETRRRQMLDQAEMLERVRAQEHN